MVNQTQSIIQTTTALIFGTIGATTFSLNSISQAQSIFEISQNCTKAQRGTAPNCPLPISFSQGSYGALVNDSLNASPEIRYRNVARKPTPLGVWINRHGLSNDLPYNDKSES